MNYLSRSSMFIQDKHTFFKSLPTDMNLLTKNKKNMEHKIKEIEEGSPKIKDYPFLLENQKILENEFTQMFAALQNKKDENNAAFWLYCYYCAMLLESFYKSYSKKDKEEEYLKLKQEINNRLLDKEETATLEGDFIESVKRGFIDLIKTPLHLSKIRDYVLYGIFFRVYWLFCRLTLIGFLTLAQNAGIITELKLNEVITHLDIPLNVFNGLSVALPLAHFLIETVLLLRHTFFPTEEEKTRNVTTFERFKYEFNKRKIDFATDLMWGAVNLVINFILAPKNPLIVPMVAVCLIIDLALILYRTHVARQEYLTKIGQYSRERDIYNNLERCRGINEKQRLAHLEMLQKQIDELEINWCIKHSAFNFVTVGASIIILGCVGSIFNPALLFMGIIGVAMYFSVGSYTRFKEKSLRFDQVKYSGDNLTKSLEEYQTARSHFIFTMVKSAIVPSFLIAALALYWPAAVAFTVLYLGFELYHVFKQQSSKKESMLIHSEVFETSKAEKHEVKNTDHCLIAAH